MNARIHASLGAVAIALLLPMTAQAIDQAYRKKLERSGCTQVSEMQGCDINKTKAENAKAGFGPAAKPAAAAAAKSPYSGQWIARSTSGMTVATIGIDSKERVTVNGKAVTAKRSDGALVFKVGRITYTIQGDPRLTNENSWFDADAQTTGPIRRK
jgi:3-hydroxyacyl-CoA dehydrogenase